MNMDGIGERMGLGTPPDLTPGAGPAVVAKTSGPEPVIRGGGVSVEERLRELVRGGQITDAEALQSMMQKLYETEKATIDNMKPSEKQVELSRRRQQELKKLMRELEDRKIDFEEALVRFKNMLDPDDVELLALKTTMIVA